MSNLSSPRITKTPTAITQIGRLERVTLGERVHAELRELLMSGELAPGQKMSLRSVAETLGVSIMPVREAVARLVSDRSLEVLPNRAVRVPLMSRVRFRELTAVRLAIEGFAAEEAARNRSDADICRHAAFRTGLSGPGAQPGPAGRPSCPGQQGIAFRRLQGHRSAYSGWHHRGSMAEDRAGAQFRPQNLTGPTSYRRRGGAASTPRGGRGGQATERPRARR